MQLTVDIKLDNLTTDADRQARADAEPVAIPPNHDMESSPEPSMATEPGADVEPFLDDNQADFARSADTETDGNSVPDPEEESLSGFETVQEEDSGGVPAAQAMPETDREVDWSETDPEAESGTPAERDGDAACEQDDADWGCVAEDIPLIPHLILQMSDPWDDALPEATPIISFAETPAEDASLDMAPQPGSAPEPVTSHVMVSRAYTNAARRPVQLKATTAFIGTGIFTQSKDNVRFFTSPTGGTELSFNGVDNQFTAAQLTAGVTLFAQGQASSLAIGDVELTLTLQPSGKATVARMTAVELTLDVCVSRGFAGAEPGVLSPVDKINVGRVVHVQDSGSHHGRALLIVREVSPRGFGANLVIAPIDDRVRLFAASDEIAAAGQMPLATPYVFSASAIPPDGLRFWAEGVAVSAAMRDTGVRLTLDEAGAEGDRIAITVARLRRLEARIPSTHAHHSRVGNSPVPPHVIRRGTTPAPDPSNYEIDFVANPPLVLMANSVRPSDPIALTIQVEPGGIPVSWSIQRDTRAAPDGDAPSILELSPNPVPTLTPDPCDPLKASLLADAVGSFHIRPFIDCNGNGEYDGVDTSGVRLDCEPFLLMSLVLVDARLHQDNSISHPGNVGSGVSSTGSIAVWAGSFSDDPQSSGIHMNVLVDVIGGGADGRRGLASVFAGWVQNLTHDKTIATYLDSTVDPPMYRFMSRIYVLNPDAASRGEEFPVFAPNDPPPVPAAMPLLDSGWPDAGRGGATATLKWSRIASRTNLAVGQRWQVTAIDCPRDSARSCNPAFPFSRTCHFRYDVSFRAHLALWTNVSKEPYSSGHTAERLYVVLHRIAWGVQGEWALDSETLRTLGAPTIRITERTTSAPLVPASELPVEVRFPRLADCQAEDARI